MANTPTHWTTSSVPYSLGVNYNVPRKEAAAFAIELSSKVAMEAQALHGIRNPIAPAKAGRGQQEPSLGNIVPPRLRSSPRPIVQSPALLALQTPLFMSAAGSVGATEVAALPSTKLPTPLDDPFPLPFDSSAGDLRCCRRRRRRRLLAGLASALALPAAPLLARARGLFQMPPFRLSNRYKMKDSEIEMFSSLGLFRPPGADPSAASSPVICICSGTSWCGRGSRSTSGWGW